VIPIASNIAVHPTARDEARAALRHRLGVPEDAPVAAFFGFLHPVKGLPYLLDAVTRLRDQHPWLRLVIAGGFTSLALPQVEADAYRGEIEATIARLGLQPVVHLTGWQPEPEVSRLLQGADLAVLPFTQGVTAKSGSLFAVLAHGLPTVATSPPGEPSDPEPGMLRVPVRDPQALADAIGRLLDDPDLAARLAAEARAAVPADPWGAIANAHCEVYTQLLSARRPVPAA
jgi:glycosyltransferase involved in cell wall biosynthesis